MDDFDPSMLDDRDSDRRRKRRRAREMQESEVDDAWAAANEDDIPDHHAHLEDLAAYYVYDEQERRRREDREDDESEATMPDLGPLPPSAAKRVSEHKRTPREDRLKSRYDLNQVYAGSPSYKKKRGIVGKVMEGLTGSETVLPSGKAKHDPNYQPGFLSTLPFWAILILVFIGVTLAVVIMLACAWMTVMLK